MELGGQQGEVSQATCQGQLETPTGQELPVIRGRKVTTFTAEQEEDFFCSSSNSPAHERPSHSANGEPCYTMTPSLPQWTLFIPALSSFPFSSIQAHLLSFISPDLPIALNTTCLSITAVFYYSQINPFCWSNNW